MPAGKGAIGAERGSFSPGVDSAKHLMATTLNSCVYC
jgi:hypothetical protein